ncbi:MAG: hypothetical protein ACR2NB_09435 [Solirubrobacteraceae bacterium]
MLRPLRDTTADRRRLVGFADELGRLERAVRERRNVLITGPRRSGRTTLLNLAPMPGRTRVAVGGETARTPAALLLSVVDRLESRPIEELGRLAALDTQLASMLTPTVTARLLDALDSYAAARTEPVVVLVDGIRPQVAHELFGLQRNDLWALGAVQWVLAADHDDRAQLLAPPADAFWGEQIVLQPLTPADAARLLAAHGHGEAALTGVPGDRWWPGTLLDAAEGRHVRRLDGDRVGSRGRLLAWLRARGAASASDPELLETLGISRQRAAQLLDELHEAGDVEASVARPAGEGRPRKLYTLASSSRPA